ncbi:MAG: hypothetical protein ABIM40_00770, partial [Pseudomonadota bacterium]
LFLNNSIGLLLKDFDWVYLNDLLSFENAEPSQKETIQRVLTNSEDYHRNPQKRKAVDDALARMAEEMD